ncbi:MAG: choice-of-anchor B family protein [Planctomycetota bacterium]|nr:choice-of-anchor B family protein [Planctomycetota bacterium]
MLFARPSFARVALAAAALTLTALSTATHAQQNQDWRKSADPAEPIFGEPIIGPISARNGDAGGFPASNITLFSWLPLNQFPNNQRSANDCWGYVSPAGREYVLLGLQSGFSVLDVTVPTNPVQIGFVPGNNSAWRDIKVIGNYAYGVSEGGLGIQVIDLADVDNGNVRHVRNKTQNGHTSTHNIISNPDSGYIYLSGANIANGGLVAISLADPEDPVIAGAWTGRYVHDAQVVTYTDGPFAGREIAYCGTGSGGIYVVDVTNKSNMFTVATHRYPGTHYTHQAWLSQDRQYLFTNDEMDEGTSFDVTTTHVIDVSNPANPHEVTTFTSGLASTDHNLYVVGDLAYQANYTSGLRVFDISDPFNAQEIASLDTAPNGNSPGYHGAWSNYPFLPSGTIAISDIERGLFLLRLGESGLAFDFPESLPETLRPGLTRTVRTTLVEDGVNLDPDSVQLILDAGDGQTAIPMNSNGEGLFEAVLPAGECFDTYEFWFTAQDTTGLSYVEPFNAPISGGYTASIQTGTESLFADDFNTDTGWLVDNANATTGGWARVTPVQGNAVEPDSDADGSGLAYITGATPGESLDGGPIFLTSPVFDLESTPYANISYKVWYNVDGNLAPHLVVDISNNNGLTWTNVTSHAPEDFWRDAQLAVADFVTPTDAVRLRFRASNVIGSAIVEAGVDAVHLTTPVCDPCIADYDGSGTVNTQDFLAFLNDFTGSTNEGDPDLNGDGEVNTLDFLIFLNLFAQGCD